MRLSVLILLILGWFVTLTPHGSAGQGAVLSLSADVDELELYKSPTDDPPAHVLGGAPLTYFQQQVLDALER